MHPKVRGEQSEAAVIFHLVDIGLTVLEPFGDNERYDIVVEEDDEFYRIQVKTGRLENGRIQFETRSSGTLTRKVSKEGYEGQIDVFAVYSPEMEQVYVVPFDAAPKTSMGLRIKEAEKSSPNINWADEFKLSEWVKKIANS